MTKLQSLQRRLPYFYVIGGSIALVSSFIITLEKNKLLADPNYIPPCSINPIVGCGSVMQSWQAELFGFPNPLLGIIGFSVIITVGMAMLAGAQFKRWFWVGMQVGTFLATVFVYWLFYQAVFKIGSLCLYCMVVWSMTIPLFLYTFLYNKKEGAWLKHSFWLLLSMYLVIALSIWLHLF